MRRMLGLGALIWVAVHPVCALAQETAEGEAQQTEIDEPPRSQLAPDPRFDALEKRIASAAQPATAPAARVTEAGVSDASVAEEQAAEAEADAAAMASAKTIVADPSTNPSRR